MFVFDGGQLSPEQINQLRLTDGELSGYAFYPPTEAGAYLFPRQRQRLAAALEALEGPV